MRLLAKNIPLSLDAMRPEATKALTREVARALGVKSASISDVTIVRKSVDARKKDNVHFVVNILFEPKLDKPLEFWCERAKRGVSIDIFSPLPVIDIPKVPVAQVVPDATDVTDVTSAADATGSAGCQSGDSMGSSDVDRARPVVVGAGPAGLFCALYLARAGMRPILIERGQAVEKRLQAVKAFAEGGDLDPESNIQFGEGGAGTFSDGKLNTGTKSPFNRFVLEEFVAAGAPSDILVDAKPHIGTDYLVNVVANLRLSIIEAGGELLFSTKLTDIELACDRSVVSVVVEDACGTRNIPTDTVVLACGHSARDVFELMALKSVEMERKPFAVGVRVEHPQKLINAIQYGKYAGHSALPAADYKLAVKTSTGRGVYSFCMCPGGEVVAAASERGGVCVNGMSNHARSGANANSALLVEVLPGDLDGDNVLEGIYLQRDLEARAYASGGNSYKAPMERMSEFLGSKMPDMPRYLGSFAKVKPTYSRGVVSADLDECLPAFIADGLREGIVKMDAKMRGFAYPDACLTAIEARSSSPVRIIRDRTTFVSKNTKGLYPTGEGAGYAGGIMSAASDGLRVAKRIVEQAIFSNELKLALDYLRRGRAVVFPTDTVCGIGMSIQSAPDAGYLFKVKGRRSDKPLQWLVSNAKDIDRYAVDIPAYVKKLIDAFWPGGLTIVVKAAPDVAKEYVAADGTIGFRMPADEVALDLIRLAEGPLITSSANHSGSPAASAISSIDAKWLKDVDALVIHGFDDARRAAVSPVASTVVDCTSSSPKILREGCISVDEIMAAI